MNLLSFVIGCALLYAAVCEHRANRQLNAVVCLMLAAALLYPIFTPGGC